jgi:hypothetical protein
VALDIECEEPEITTCECCGHDNLNLFRTIYDGEKAVAIYMASLPSHAGFPVSVFLVIGSFDEEVSTAERFSMAFKMISQSEGYGTSIIEPSDGGWDETEIATMLSQVEARARFSKEIFQFSDLILDHDPVIRSYLDASPTVATSGPTLH